MNHHPIAKAIFLTLLSLLLLSLAACSVPSEPKLIGAYTTQGDAGSQPVPREQIVYDATMDMEVRDPEAAAQKAEERAYDYGGYLVSAQTWTQTGQRYIQLVLAVPAPNYEALHQVILDLGRLKSEHISGEWVSSRYGSDWSMYSEITVTFHPGSVIRPSASTSGWHPEQTLAKAWGVFVAIFGFLVDILIWVLVVGGPFFLIALLLSAIARKRRSNP